MVVLVWTPSGAPHHFVEESQCQRKGATAAGFADPDDAPDLSAPEWAAKIDAAKVQRGRPKSAQPKVSTTIRLDADVIAFFRKRGRGWQTEINAALRKAIEPLKKRAD